MVRSLPMCVRMGVRLQGSWLMLRPFSLNFFSHLQGDYYVLGGDDFDATETKVRKCLEGRAGAVSFGYLELQNFNIAFLSNLSFFTCCCNLFIDLKQCTSHVQVYLPFVFFH